MKVYIDADEWYPVYSLTPVSEPKDTGLPIEVSEELWQWYVITFDQWKAVQNAISDAYDQAYPRPCGHQYLESSDGGRTWVCQKCGELIK